MAISFLSIQADVESQINGLIATTPTIAETAYSAVVSGTSVVADRTSTDWGLPQIQQAILDTEYEIIKEICFNGRHPERADFNTFSASLSSPATLPLTSGGGKMFLGPFNYAIETSVNTLSRERELQVVQWAIKDSNSAFSSPRVGVYAVAGGIVWHNSSTGLIFHGSGENRATVSGNVYSPVSIRCRDYHRAAIVAGSLVKLLAKEGQWLDAMQANAALYSAHIEQIRGVGQQMAVPFTAR